MSMLRSKKASSRDVTVSHVKQRVSEVKIPEKSPCTQDSDEERGFAVMIPLEAKLSDPPSVVLALVPNKVKDIS